MLKAHRELEHAGLAEGRPGAGTFVTRSLAGDSLAAHHKLRVEPGRSLGKARSAGLDEASVEALFDSTLHASAAQSQCRSIPLP